jgi:hypothetical protein
MSDHAYFPCELANFIADKGIQMGEMSKVGWQMWLVKHAI